MLERRKPLWKNHARAEGISSEIGTGAVGIDFRGKWRRFSTSSKGKHCFVCKLRKETNKDHDGRTQQQDKGHIAYSGQYLSSLSSSLLLEGHFMQRKLGRREREQDQ